MLSTPRRTNLGPSPRGPSIYWPSSIQITSVTPADPSKVALLLLTDLALTFTSVPQTATAGSDIPAPLNINNLGRAEPAGRSTSDYTCQRS